MQKTIFPALLAAMLACSGCFDFTEEIWLNKDRSGRYEMTVNMGAGAIGDMLQSAMGNSWDSLQALGKAIPGLDTLYFFSQLPDSVKRLFPYRDVLDQSSLRVSMENGLNYRFCFDFRQVEDIARFWQTFQAVEQIRKDSTVVLPDVFEKLSKANFAGIFNGTPEMRFDGKRFFRTLDNTELSAPVREMASEFEEGPLASILFRNNRYRIIFHLPKKVRSVSGNGFLKDRKDKKTVRAEFKLDAVLRDPTVLACTIVQK